MRISVLTVLLILSLPACASVAKDSSRAEKPGSLSARNLAPGECGLFVWTADAKKTFVLFSQSQKSTAVWVNGTEEGSLEISNQSGTPSEGQYPEQNYDAVSLKLVLKDPQVITQGTRYKAGTLTQKSEEGWSRVTPVVGLSACQAG